MGQVVGKRQLQRFMLVFALRNKKARFARAVNVFRLLPPMNIIGIDPVVNLLTQPSSQGDAARENGRHT
jgi:hypothetical protein